MEVIINGTSIVPATTATVLPSRPAMRISSGCHGPVLFGFNQHAWGWNRTRYDGLGAKMLRIGSATLSRYIQFGSYPGPAFTGANQNYNWVVQQCVNGAVTDGFTVILGIVAPDYTTMDFTQLAKLCGEVAQANAGKESQVLIEIGNEPNFNVIGGEKYAKMLLDCSPPIRAVSPLFKILGPTINASYLSNAIKFVNTFMAVPGVAQALDIGSFHPYYNTPEVSHDIDVIPFINRINTPAVAAGRTDIEYTVDEAGYSNATGAMVRMGLDPTQENLGATGGTTYQNKEVCADYYSRQIAIYRATDKLRYITFYAQKNEGANQDPNFNNGGAHFGVTEENGFDKKPAGVVCADMLPLVHTATGAVQFHRDTRAKGNRFVRLDLPGTQALIAWAPGDANRDLVAVKVEQPCTLSVNVAGAAPATKFVPAGYFVLPLDLGRRSIIVKADKPISFPHFPGA